jgi:hypothetical protein
VGENFDGENWQGNNGRIKSLKLYYDGVNDDLTPVVTEEEGDSIEYFMIDEGTNLIAFNSNNSFINLEPGLSMNTLKKMDYQMPLNTGKKTMRWDAMAVSFINAVQKHYSRLAR